MKHRDLLSTVSIQVPKVVRRVIYRLFFLYWMTLIGMGVMVPSDSPELADALACVPSSRLAGALT